MRLLLRRLLPGISLIALAGAVLLISDWDQRTGGARKRIPRVAMVQYSSQPVLDEGVQGILDMLAYGGFRDPDTLSLRRFNAENDLPTAHAIARQVTSGEYDLVVTATTLSMQTVANANKAGKVIHVFGIVADPFVSGIGLSRERPDDRPAHITGIGSFVPVSRAFTLARRMFPALRTVGVAWNPAEANSEAFTKAARVTCRELGITLLEANVESSAAVSEAVLSLISRGSQALWVGGDVTVLAALESVVGASRRARIPVFSIVPPSVKRGTLFDVGANFYQIGWDTGAVAVRILQGTDPSRIPVRDFVPGRLAVSRTALAGLKDPWRLPEDVAAQADLLLDEKGLHERKAPASDRPLARKWKIHLVELNNVLDVEETEQGVLDGLREAGLVQGRDYEAKIRNAQGDMATVTGLVDAALAEGADMLITLSTPTLQAAIQRARRIPIVFTYVANGVLAGAGRSREDHLPNVTGVDVVAAYDEMIAILKECMPKVRRVGTLFVPAEVNMVFNKDLLVASAAKAGIEVVTVPVSSSSDVPDAALALAARNLDAFCQIAGNLTASAFAGIAQAARKSKLPIFAFQKVQVRAGAVVALARDYHDAGREAALMAARIMRGESPARIPFQPLTRTRLIVNPEAARAVNLRLPDSLVRRAEELVGR